MLMSQAAKSFGDMGCPNFCPSAAVAARQPSASVSRTMDAVLSGIDMAHLAIGVDCPARNRIEMTGENCGHGRHTFGLTALRYECRPGRLNVAGLIRRTALQDCGLPAPDPGHAEASKGLAEHRRIERSQCPAPAAIGRDLDLVDRAMARIGDARNLVEARSLHCQSRRRPRNEGFDLLREEELPRLTARQQFGVLLG